jgi:hypothetical protein
VRLSHESNRGHRCPNMWDVDAQRLQHVRCRDAESDSCDSL